MSHFDPIPAATLLAARRRAGQTGPRLPASCRPMSPDDALAVQAEVTRLLGETVGGWKCGMPADDKLVVAPIHTSTIHIANPCPVWADGETVRVEPELAFVLVHDLPARPQPYTEAEIDAAIGHARLALELIASRYEAGAEISFNEKLADGLVNQGLYLGPEITLAQARAASEIAIQLTTAAGEVRELAGVHPNRAPLAPLYWLVNFLRGRGVSLRAGQAIITGSYAGTFPLPVGVDIRCQYGELGGFSVQFAGRGA